MMSFGASELLKILLVSAQGRLSNQNRRHVSPREHIVIDSSSALPSAHLFCSQFILFIWRVSFACTLLLSAFLKVSELRLKLIPSGRELDSWRPPEASIVFRVCV